MKSLTLIKMEAVSTTLKGAKPNWRDAADYAYRHAIKEGYDEVTARELSAGAAEEVEERRA